MNYYDIVNIISYMDIDMMLLMRRINNLFNREIGQIKIFNFKKLINIGDTYYDFIGIRIGSYRVSKEGINACINAYEDTIQNRQFSDACYSGKLDMVNIMIEKITGMTSIPVEIGAMPQFANIWNRGLSGACLGGNLEIVKLLIEKGATECTYCHKSMQEHLQKMNK